MCASDAPFFLAASAECKLIDLMQPDFSLELRAPRMAMFKAEGGVLRSYAPPKVRRVCQFPLLLKAGVKLRLIFGVDFSADSFKEPLVRSALTTSHHSGRLRFKWFNNESCDSPNEPQASPPGGPPISIQ